MKRRRARQGSLQAVSSARPGTLQQTRPSTKTLVALMELGQETQRPNPWNVDEQMSPRQSCSRRNYPGFGVRLPVLRQICQISAPSAPFLAVPANPSHLLVILDQQGSCLPPSGMCTAIFSSCNSIFKGLPRLLPQFLRASSKL